MVSSVCAVVTDVCVTTRPDACGVYCRGPVCAGMGYVPWESIWGIWNPLSEGDGEALRRTMHILKFFNAAVVGTGWFAGCVCYCDRWVH